MLIPNEPPSAQFSPQCNRSVEIPSFPTLTLFLWNMSKSQSSSGARFQDFFGRALPTGKPMEGHTNGRTNGQTNPFKDMSGTLLKCQWHARLPMHGIQLLAA